MKERIIMSKAKLGDFKNFRTELDNRWYTKPITVIVTHIADLDGLFSGLLIDAITDRNTIIIPLGNSDDMWLMECLDWIDRLHIDIHELYITDIGLFDDTHKYIANININKKIYIDHHSSALDQLDVLNHIYDEVIVNTGFCATLNCFNRFKHDYEYAFAPFERYIKFVNDRDLWLKQFPESNKLATIYKMFFFYKMFDYILSGDEIMTADGQISPKYDFVLQIEFEKIEAEAKRYLSFMKTVKVGDAVFGYALYTGNNASDIAEYYRCNTPYGLEDIDVLAFIYPNEISLRTVSDRNFNVSVFAKQRNGGGHPKAAGYPLNNQDILIDRFISSIFK